MARNNFNPVALQVEEWIKYAESDEKNASSLLKHRDGTPRGVCFLAQQMAEKYLKAFLVARKKWFPKIHYLDKLVELCGGLEQDFLELKQEAVFLNEFYSDSRYPMSFTSFFWEDAEEAFKSASKIKEFVLSHL